MTDMIELELSLTSLNGNIYSKLILLKDICYLGMDENHIHVPIPVDLENMRIIKYLSIESLKPNTWFNDFPGTSSAVVGFTHIVIFMLKGLVNTPTKSITSQYSSRFTLI